MELKSLISNSKLSTKNLFDKLSVIENFETLMPESISKFELIDSESFLFSIKGMPTFKLKIEEKLTSKKIVLKSVESKITFYLTGYIKESDDKNSTFQIEFKGQLNPMMEMMVKKPLQTFIDDLSKNVKNLN
ncbi:MAG: orotate phosphoribosyltransferase [Flavobacteriaceae bacterium]|nr:orotate phosphoribosyltransferase [Flavobacteriaceae bacterium]MBK55867.1 orotate phosphoribosyltransferase [Flavobacteriaceae bacterium]|tara:strand:+ start:1489 stop:1884 length:396 start_codon:yes stop_codon:yes gene_type:complete